jgi:hypothetical protein
VDVNKIPSCTFCFITVIYKSGFFFFAQITCRDEEMAPFISELKRNYIFGGISSVAANVSIKV